MRSPAVSHPTVGETEATSISTTAPTSEGLKPTSLETQSRREDTTGGLVIEGMYPDPPNL